MRSPGHGLDQMARYDDSVLEPLTVAHIAGIFPAIFTPNWGQGAGLGQVWSGILGMTGDMAPLVGRLNGEITGRPLNVTEGKHKPNPGEWVSAGFSGDGMVWAWLSGTALGVMLSGREEESLPELPERPGGKLADWFPEELLVSDKRLRSTEFSNILQ